MGNKTKRHNKFSHRQAEIFRPKPIIKHFFIDTINVKIKGNTPIYMGK